MKNRREPFLMVPDGLWWSLVVSTKSTYYHGTQPHTYHSFPTNSDSRQRDTRQDPLLSLYIGGTMERTTLLRQLICVCEKIPSHTNSVLPRGEKRNFHWMQVTQTPFSLRL